MSDREVKIAVAQEKDFWEYRYSEGASSGDRSIFDTEEEWSLIEKYLPIVNHVIDLGCGDLKFWQDRDCEDYIGIDIAENIIKANKRLRPHWKFICMPAEIYLKGLRKQNVFCFNLLFHIMHPENFKRILKNICRYAIHRIFLETWIENPLEKNQTDGLYQYHHLIEDSFHLFEGHGFILAEWINLNGKGFFIFEKVKK